MDIKDSVINGDLYIKLIGELDEYTAQYTKDNMDNILSNGHYNNVILELSNLDFMDSTGIGVILGRYKKLHNNNRNMYISNPNKTIEKIFRMSGMFEIMPKIN